MQLIALELSDNAARGRSTLVSADELGLGRPPEPSEQVVLHDTWTGDYFYAVIAEAADGAYEIQLGIRLPEPMALGRVTGFPGPSASAPTRAASEVAVELRSSLTVR
jgi:hypothetical protein